MDIAKDKLLWKIKTEAYPDLVYEPRHYFLNILLLFLYFFILHRIKKKKNEKILLYHMNYSNQNERIKQGS